MSSAFLYCTQIFSEKECSRSFLLPFTSRAYRLIELSFACVSCPTTADAVMYSPKALVRRRLSTAVGLCIAKAFWSHQPCWWFSLNNKKPPPRVAVFCCAAINLCVIMDITTCDHYTPPQAILALYRLSRRGGVLRLGHGKRCLQCVVYRLQNNRLLRLGQHAVLDVLGGSEELYGDSIHLDLI